MKRLAVIAVVLAGCASDNTQVVPDRYFTTYQAMVANDIWRLIEAGPYAKTTPGPVKIAYSECSAAYFMSKMTPEETRRLNAYASHEVTMTAGEIEALNQRVGDSLGGDLSYETMDKLSSICPNEVPNFKRYFRP